MLEMNAFPPKTSLRETLELYFQCCRHVMSPRHINVERHSPSASLETNTESMAVMAASLANHGVCPLTEDRIFARSNVRACLSVMSSCGMYDYSGMGRHFSTNSSFSIHNIPFNSGWVQGISTSRSGFQPSRASLAVCSLSFRTRWALPFIHQGSMKMVFVPL